ncbi:hypothetical protein CAEBREN_15062 [Caenorhabditis brenneri]|uniref:Uncharacterized protein n=1 Tax=Caenorhabditis brenneri TaxID=135651 RepID=G0NQK1_CAEBE|nr:hypothetical protein CAEBREN_15062 [Caenorhabditis brenneri]
MPRPDTEGLLKEEADKVLEAYFKSQEAEIDDLIIGPCYDEDKDDRIFGKLSGNGPLAAQERRDGRVRVGHEGGVGEFLAKCPHLDATRALTLLSEHPMGKAIEIGKKMIMAPRGHVSKMVEKILEDPLDHDFQRADAQDEKMKRQKRALGKKYVPPPVLRRAEIEKRLADAEDPDKVDQEYRHVDWEAAIAEENNRRARADKARAKKAKAEKAKAEKARAKKARAEEARAEKAGAAKAEPIKRKHSSPAGKENSAKRARRDASEDGPSTSGPNNSTEATSKATMNVVAKPKTTPAARAKETTQKK